MFDIPGFNPSAMSDDELLSKQAELSRRFGWANRFSSSGDITTQLWSMIAAIEAERRDRMLRYIFSERQKMFPEIIETEPDLAKEHKKKAASHNEKEDAMSNRRKVGKERLIMTKTTTPPQIAVQPHAPQHRNAAPETPQSDDENRPKDE